MKKSILYGFLLIFLSCQNTNQSSDERTNNLLTDQVKDGVAVNISVIKDSIFQSQLISNGKIEAIQKTELRFNSGQSIVNINVVNGQLVEKGTVLGVLDNELLKAQLNKAKIDLEKAESQLRIEKINYGAGTDGKIKSEVLKNLKIKSGYFEAQNSVENAQIQYDQTFIRAHFKGQIANLEAKEGDYISSADVFCTLVNLNDLEVTFLILESELRFVSKNQKLKIIPFSDTNREYGGVVREINPLVDENGLIKVRANIVSKGDFLFDGMNAKVVISEPLKDVIVVPKSALVLRSNKEVVFTYEDGVAKWNYVELAGENSTEYAIKKGLQLSDTIIVAGNLNLAHNSRVVVENQ